MRISLRPSGCGGRRDAVPPHVEKRRRLRRPSSFIMGTAGAPLVCGRKEGEGLGSPQETHSRVEGRRSVPRSERAGRIDWRKRAQTNRAPQTASNEAVCSSLYTSFNRLLPSSLTHWHSAVCVCACMGTAAAWQCLITKKLRPSYTRSYCWKGEMELSFNIS